MSAVAQVPARKQDAFCTSGTSPTRRRCPLPSRPSPLDIHLLGPGHVGRALLELLTQSNHARVVAVSDSSATVHDPRGVDLRELLRWKAGGAPLARHERSLRMTTIDAVQQVSAAIVVDTTPTRFERRGWVDIGDSVLSRGARLALASKDGLCRAVDRWLSPGTVSRIGCNAVLGGTGRLLRDELPSLRAQCTGIAFAGNASTTTIISCIERGGTIDDGLNEARDSGVLEPDPSLDLRGVDASVKLAIVVGAITGKAVEPSSIEAEDLRDQDAELLRWRAANGRSTRMVGRWSPDRGAKLAFEEVEAGDPLRVPGDRVVYRYDLADGTTRLHVGWGLGPRKTAEAILTDITAWNRRPS